MIWYSVRGWNNYDSKSFSGFFNPSLTLGKRKLRRSFYSLINFKCKSGVCMMHPDCYSLPQFGNRRRSLANVWILAHKISPEIKNFTFFVWANVKALRTEIHVCHVLLKANYIFVNKKFRAIRNISSKGLYLSDQYIITVKKKSWMLTFFFIKASLSSQTIHGPLFCALRS